MQPTEINAFNWYERIDLLMNYIIHFGLVNVNGLNLVPNPPTSIMPFIRLILIIFLFKIKIDKFFNNANNI